MAVDFYIIFFVWSIRVKIGSEGLRGEVRGRR